MNIIINGRIPSKQNSKKIVRNGSRVRLISSDAYKSWHTDATIQLYKQRVKAVGIEHCSIELDIYFPDMRVADLTNKAESVMDLLVDFGVLKDDNWKVVHSVTIKGDIDRDNPRVEIRITI